MITNLAVKSWVVVGIVSKVTAPGFLLMQTAALTVLVHVIE